MPRRSREHWQPIVAAFEESGQTQKEFCDARGLKLATLQYWLYRIRRETAARDPAREPQPLSSKLATTLFELVPCAVALIDRDRRIVAANRAFEAIFGHWDGDHCYEVFKRRHRPCGRCAAATTFDSGETCVTDEIGVDRGGAETHYQLTTAPVRNERGQVEFVLEMATDVTALRLLEERYRLLFERVPCHVSVLDEMGRIIDANWRHEETFGPVKGRACDEVYGHEAAWCETCPAKAALADQRVHAYRNDTRDKHGRPIHLFGTTAPFPQRDAGGRHTIQLASDETDVVEVRAQRDRLLGGVAAAGGGVLARLGAAIGQIAAEDEAAAPLKSAADELGAILSTLERFQRVQQLRRQELVPGELLRRVADEATSLAANVGATLRVEVEGGLPPVNVDPEVLGSCLTALLRRACTAASTRRDRSIVLGARRRQGGGVTLEVSHAAAADDPADAYLVMDPNANQAVLERAIEAHGGRLVVVSKGGRLQVQLDLPPC